MRKIIGTLAAAALALAVTHAQDKSTAKLDATAKVLIANERALYTAAANADKATFVSLVLSDGVWTTKQGWIPMKAFIDGLGELKLTKWDVDNPQVTWLGEDSALVLYVWTGNGDLQAQPLAPRTLASTVWTKRDGKWLAAHHQETDLTK